MNKTTATCHKQKHRKKAKRHRSAEDETSTGLKRSAKMFAHVLALCLMLRFLVFDFLFCPNYRRQLDYSKHADYI